jgi:hypothetical protein
MDIPDNRKIPAEQLKGIQIDLGITDETTHLLTPVPIRKGAGDEPDELASLGEVETEIATTVPTISEQFTVSGGQAFFATQFDTSTASNITFTRPRRYAGAFSEGEEKRVTKPSYSPVITISKTNAKQGCKVELYHSGILVPSFLVDELDEDWGTKPEWLTVIGDAYLVGSDHMNLIKFTYYEFDKVGSTIYQDEVVCEVIAIANGNMVDAEGKLELFKIIDLKFNENETVGANTLINSSNVYSEFLTPQVVNPSAGTLTYDDLGSGNFALRTVNASGLKSNRPYVLLPINNNNTRLFQTEITVFARVRLLSGPGSEIDRGIIGNRNNNRGFQIIRTTTGEINFRVGSVDDSASTSVTSSSADLQIGSNYYLVVCRFRFDGTNRIFDIWVKSSNASRNLTNVFSVSTASASRSANHLADINMDFISITATGARDSVKDEVRVYNKFLDYSTEIEPIAFLMDGPNNG